ncbi:enoyl-CoA hydratase/isomerase family protein [Oceanobacillus senegalensis]|uniref:enoyl-CoA hydratase/isomerase family protein n=1 Tax=Oceanobacillus senegalensis TaxID=1936063 RepID=UPI000A3120A6|nr:enoyl-CoA hydratase-related protein [Oceanobacillus senegalensis]
MSYENIIVNIEQNTAYLAINRPEVRNALDKQTLIEIVDALEVLSNNNEVGCVVFTGTGDKAFASGADINQLIEKTAIDTLKNDGMQAVYDVVENFSKPTIAMVNGYALGGGCELAMACDIRIASTNAKFGLPELNLSIIPGAGGTQRLARLVGKGKALDMILTGKIISGKEAEHIGLVSEVTAPDKLTNVVKEYTKKIVAKGPLAVKLAKIAMNYGTESDLKTGLMIENLAQAVLMSTEDKSEGVHSFLDKRKPDFKGM